MATKLIYNRTKKAAMNPIKAFSKTADLFIAIGEALSSKNPKSELQKLSKRYGFKHNDLKQAVEAYIKYDIDNSNKYTLKELGFSETSLILITKDYKNGTFEKYHVDSIERAIDKSKVLNEKSLGGIMAWTIPTTEFNDEVYDIIKNHTDSDDITKYGYKQLEFSE